MTKQEILEYFKDINHAYNESTRLDDLSHMLDELMQSNSDEDCISRQAGIDIIDRWLSCDDYNEAERHIMRAMQSVLYDLPPVTPKPKTDVLDNIRAEIEEVQTYKMFEGEDTVYVERKDVLAIIDKCKAESER